MAGIPTESPRVLRESLGSSHNRLTSAEDYLEALLSGYPPVGLLDAKNVYHAEQKGNRLPGLNAGACAHHGVNVRVDAGRCHSTPRRGLLLAPCLRHSRGLRCAG